MENSNSTLLSYPSLTRGAFVVPINMSVSRWSLDLQTIRSEIAVRHVEVWLAWH